MFNRIGAILLFLPGCVGYNDNVVVDSKFTEQEVEWIQKSIDLWVEATDSAHAAVSIIGQFNSATFTKRSFNTQYDTTRIFKVSKEDPGYRDLISNNKAAGYYHELYGNIFIIENANEEEIFLKIAIHEFGHMFGLGHSATGIMSASVSATDPCITETDLKRFCARQECGPESKVTCFGQQLEMILLEHEEELIDCPYEEK